MKKLYELGYKIYATYKTHKFLKKNGIEAILVHKISEPHKHPNLKDLLQINRFDLIINIPFGRRAREKEMTDGRFIRKMAVETNTPLITSLEVARQTIDQLYNLEKHR